MCAHTRASVSGPCPGRRRTANGPANLLACWLYSITNFKHNYLRRFPLKLAIPSEGSPWYCSDKFLVPTAPSRYQDIIEGHCLIISLWDDWFHQAFIKMLAVIIRFPLNYICKQLLLVNNVISLYGRSFSRKCKSFWFGKTLCVLYGSIWTWVGWIASVPQSPAVGRLQALNMIIALSSS